MEYCSPFSESSEISAELASVLSELSPGDLNTVFLLLMALQPMILLYDLLCFIITY